MNETMIAFTEEEFNEILAYMDQCGAETIQEAILKAVREQK